MNQKKSEPATVAGLSQTGYSTDSDFFGAQTSIFKQWPHRRRNNLKNRLKTGRKTVVNSTRKRLARLVSNLANTGKLVARPPVFVASCFCATNSALEFPTLLPGTRGKTVPQVLPVYY